MRGSTAFVTGVETRKIREEQLQLQELASKVLTLGAQQQ
jgi:hypothetical protein